jgi:hypothetical protein
MTGSVSEKNESMQSGWVLSISPQEITGLNCPGKTARARGCPLVHAPGMPQHSDYAHEAPQGSVGVSRASSPSVLNG